MSTCKILIADDHSLIHRGLRQLLATRNDWEVCGGAFTGTEVVRKVQALKPDVLILDFSMPGMNGVETFRQIRQLAPDVEILILTMHDSEPIVRAAIEAGVRGYILKSDMDDRLLEAVQSLCDHQAYLSPAISGLLRNGFVKEQKTPSLRGDGSNPLTPRQREVLVLLAQGKSNKEVASAMGISTRTVEAHRSDMMARLKIRTLSGLVLYAVKHRLIEVAGHLPISGSLPADEGFVAPG